MSKVQGENVVLLVFHSGVWKTIACATDVSYVTNTDTVETSVVGSGEFRTIRPTQNSASGTFNGLVALNQAGTLALSDVRALQLNHTRLLVRYTRTSIANDVYTDELNVYLTSVPDQGGIGSMNSFSVNFESDGLITQIFTPTPTDPVTSPVMVYNYTGIGDEDTITVPALIGKNVFLAFKDGVEFRVITTGTPIGKEVKFTTGTGQLIWSVPFYAGEQADIAYQ